MMMEVWWSTLPTRKYWKKIPPNLAVKNFPFLTWQTQIKTNETMFSSSQKSWWTLGRAGENLMAKEWKRTVEGLLKSSWFAEINNKHRRSNEMRGAGRNPQHEPSWVSLILSNGNHFCFHSFGRCCQATSKLQTFYHFNKAFNFIFATF